MDFLVIDDEKTFRDATCLLIDNEGHYAEGACSGELGLTQLKEGKFDAVLLDLNLGPETGLDILEHILTREPNLPVVMFTAQGSVKNAVEATDVVLLSISGATSSLVLPKLQEMLQQVFPNDGRA
jgi:NtrC-family two-component system response regulator AlgB